MPTEAEFTYYEDTFIYLVQELSQLTQNIIVEINRYEEIDEDAQRELDAYKTEVDDNIVDFFSNYNRVSETQRKGEEYRTSVVERGALYLLGEKEEKWEHLVKEKAEHYIQLESRIIGAIGDDIENWTCVEREAEAGKIERGDIYICSRDEINAYFEFIKQSMKKTLMRNYVEIAEQLNLIPKDQERFEAEQPAVPEAAQAA